MPRRTAEFKRLCTCPFVLGSITFGLLHLSYRITQKHPFMHRLSSEQIYHPQVIKLSCIGDIHLRRSKGKYSLTSSIK